MGVNGEALQLDAVYYKYVNFTTYMTSIISTTSHAKTHISTSHIKTHIRYCKVTRSAAERAIKSKVGMTKLSPYSERLRRP